MKCSATIKGVRKLIEIDPIVFANSARNRANRARPVALTVEDDVFSQRLIKKALSACECVAVENGRDAITAYALNAPDIIFLDLEMPDINGIDILPAITSVDKDAFVVMLTAHTDKNLVEKAVKLGAEGYIAKPFQAERIRQYVDACWKRKHLN